MAFRRSGFLASLIVAAAFMVVPTASSAAQIFQLTASNIEVDDPSPLFTTNAVSGTFKLDDSVLPGGNFNLSKIADFTFNFGGIIVHLSDTQLPGGDITAFGNLSADGSSISHLDLRFDLPSTVTPCSFICAGQVQIDTFDRSNFLADDDFDTATLSFLQFDAALTRVAVPEPVTMSLFAVGLIGAGGLYRRRKRQNAVIS